MFAHYTGNSRKRGCLVRNGFTIVELSISIGLLIAITAVTIASYNNFSGSILVSNLAHEIALSIREAQAFSLNVRGFDDSGIIFDTSYGIHFAQNTPDSYILFADPNRGIGGYVYSVGNDVKNFSLGIGFKINDVCATVVGGSETRCFSGSGADRILFLDIVFDRPNPDAFFTSDRAEGYEYVEITVESPRGLLRSLEVLPTGYIHVQ